jgi:hydroxypyruvate isomerase
VINVNAPGLKWAANLSMLYRELPFLDRFAAAAEAGFDTVEFWWPRGEKTEEVEAAIASAGLAVSVLNIDSGDLEAGERGYLNRPEQRSEVVLAGHAAVALARAVRCPFVNCPVGKDSGASHENQIDSVVGALKELAAIAQPHGVTITVEPLNHPDHPTYLICSSAEGREVVKRAGPGVGLLYDAYHMGMMDEDIVAAAKSLDFVHVQFADAPGRHEPGTGHLPLSQFFDALQRSGYRGHVGLEYAPSTSTQASLQWWRERMVTAPISEC